MLNLFLAIVIHDLEASRLAELEALRELARTREALVPQVYVPRGAARLRHRA